MTWPIVGLFITLWFLCSDKALTELKARKESDSQ